MSQRARLWWSVAAISVVFGVVGALLAYAVMWVSGLFHWLSQWLIAAASNGAF